MKLVENVNPQSYGGIVHGIQDGDSKTICGKLHQARTRPTIAAQEITCYWCKAALKREPQSSHRPIRTCSECGDPWPCPTWVTETPDRCRAHTAQGKPCLNRADYSGLCRTHWRTGLYDEDMPVSAPLPQTTDIP